MRLLKKTDGISITLLQRPVNRPPWVVALTNARSAELSMDPAVVLTDAIACILVDAKLVEPSLLLGDVPSIASICDRENFVTDPLR